MKNRERELIDNAIRGKDIIDSFEDDQDQIHPPLLEELNQKYLAMQD